MTDDRLFDVDDLVEVPLVREPRRRKGPAAGSRVDGRFANDYPPEWDECPDCCGRGVLPAPPPLDFGGAPRKGPLDDDLRRHALARTMPDALAEVGWTWETCPRCLGMGSVKGRVRLEAGHRCVRCRHPYVPKGDAAMLGIERSGMHDGVWLPWSPCDTECSHRGPIRTRLNGSAWHDFVDDRSDTTPPEPGVWLRNGHDVEAFWRILTVHHLDGDKANLRWWNLVSLCQRCHLEIQARVVMERVYPHEHSEWFKPYVGGYYASVLLGEELTRDETTARLDELLALERA